MLSGVRPTATLSGAQPVEEQMCPLHRANLFSSAVLLEECSFPETSLPFQNTPFTSSCRQILTSWAPAVSQLGSAYLWDQGWSTAQGEGCFLHCWEAAGLADRRPRGAASNSLWLWRQLDLCGLCPRPSLRPYLQILVSTCPRAALSDDA